MNNQQYNQPEMEINLKEVIWDLLEQWKAILITAIAVAMLVCGVKYAKDVKSSEEAAQSKAEAEKQSEIPAQERIMTVLEGLSEDDATDVINMATQYKWLDSQKEYLKNSILMNTDPTQQRVLKIVYYISSSEQNSAALLSAYRSYVTSTSFTGELKKIIAPEAEDKYAGELVQVYFENTSFEDLYTNNLNITIIMLDDTNPEAVADLVSTKLSEQSKKLSERFNNHKLQQSFLEEAVTYNYDGVNKKTSTINGINSLQNSIKTAEGNLNEEQKTAANEIYVILKESEETGLPETNDNLSVDEKNDETIEITPLRISKKYALLGFVLGAMVYALVYLVVLIAKGQVNYASEVENYTGTRLLGELYYHGEEKGIDTLIKSKLVEKYRYRGKLDINKQLDKLRISLDAICEHTGIKDVILINLEQESENTSVVIDDIEKVVKDTGFAIQHKSFGEEFNEKELLKPEAVVVLAHKSTKVNHIATLAELCNDYDVSILGSMFAAKM